MTTLRSGAAYDIGNVTYTVAGVVADEIASYLVSPAHVSGLDRTTDWSHQSLGRGPLGIALLHIERAHAGLGSWQHAHDWLAYAAHGGVHCSDQSHLYYGAPALAFVLHGATDLPGRYARALSALDGHVAAMVRRRLDRAHARIDRAELPALSEFDTVRGLTGIGAYLLRRNPDGELLRAVLSYLIRLTEPITDQSTGEVLPGWWSGLAPFGRPSTRLPGGHANNGVAHGIAGPLALLALAMRRRVRVGGQVEAVRRICAWLDQWHQYSDAGGWWPYWITRAEHQDGSLNPSRPSRPSRPSWCYGTAGLARAQQLAAIALHDPERQHIAEHTLLTALTDPRQLDTVTDLSLCHGYAGLLQVTRHAAADALTPALAACRPDLLRTLTLKLDGHPEVVIGKDITFLDGAAGLALALHTAVAKTSPVSRWDTCLLIN